MVQSASISEPVGDRKRREAEFHNIREHLRTADPAAYKRITRNQRFYSINARSKNYMVSCLRAHVGPNARALDYCCGTGHNSQELVEMGYHVTGIDISAESVEAAKQRLDQHVLRDRTSFIVADAESTGLPSGLFDVILCNGVLHHLDLAAALPEIARLLKPEGVVLCVEALGHNPLFHLYRRLTPHMRTEWEIDHILTRSAILSAKEHFKRVNLEFFHLADLCAVPFRSRQALFAAVLEMGTGIDRLLLKTPGLKWWAWQCVFELSHPQKVA